MTGEDVAVLLCDQGVVALLALLRAADDVQRVGVARGDLVDKPVLLRIRCPGIRRHLDGEDPAGLSVLVQLDPRPVDGEAPLIRGDAALGVARALAQEGGLEDQDLNFLKTKSNTNTDNYKQGDIVKIVRLDNDLSLFI